MEKRGDQIDREINTRLETAFVAPFDREDIHVRSPTEDCRRLTEILADQGRELAAALGKLNRMKDLNDHLEKIHELEHEADGVSLAAIGRLFRDSHDALRRCVVASLTSHVTPVSSPDALNRHRRKRRRCEPLAVGGSERRGG